MRVTLEAYSHHPPDPSHALRMTVRFAAPFSRLPLAHTTSPVSPACRSFPRAAAPHPRRADSARQIHPARNATPPSGVIAPSQRTPDSASAYRLPEKSTVPARNSHPANCGSVPGQRAAAHAAAISPSAWYIW
jgi:hypothetical protein